MKSRKLAHAQQSKGGTTRAKNQSKADRKFISMLAASRRPLLHDVPTTPESLIKGLAELAAMRRWIYLGIVGADLRTIRHGLYRDELVTRYLMDVGGAIGFLGITAFGGRVSLQLFYRPLKAGTSTIEKLKRASREKLALVIDDLEASEAIT